MGILDSLKKGLCCSKKATEKTEAELSLEDKAAQIIEALGGRENIEVLDFCVTRLRLTLKNRKLANKVRLTELGSKGNVKVGSSGLQVIIGSQAVALAGIIKTKL